MPQLLLCLLSQLLQPTKHELVQFRSESLGHGVVSIPTMEKHLFQLIFSDQFILLFLAFLLPILPPALLFFEENAMNDLKLKLLRQFL